MVAIPKLPTIGTIQSSTALAAAPTPRLSVHIYSAAYPPSVQPTTRAIDQRLQAHRPALARGLQARVQDCHDLQIVREAYDLMEFASLA